MNTPLVVSAQEWEAARQQLLVKEKALTRTRDALAAERRRMPWLAVEKAYVFDGPKGKASPELIGRAEALKGRLLALLDRDLPAGPTACPICGAVGYGRGVCGSCCRRLGMAEAFRLVAEDRARRRPSEAKS